MLLANLRIRKGSCKLGPTASLVLSLDKLRRKGLRANSPRCGFELILYLHLKNQQHKGGGQSEASCLGAEPKEKVPKSLLPPTVPLNV